MEIEMQCVNMPDGSNIIRYRTVVSRDSLSVTATHWQIMQQVPFSQLSLIEQNEMKQKIE